MSSSSELSISLREDLEMFKTWSVVVALLGICLCQSRVLAQLRIVGGQTTTISSAPFMVNFRYGGKFFCGGSLITRQHVLTAAHCMKDKNIRNIEVVAGASTLSQTGIRRRVARAFIPQRFSLETKRMDVSVVKLSSPINSSSVQTIGLFSGTLRPGNRIRVYGWGSTSEDSPRNSNSLRVVTVPVIRKSRCQKPYLNRLTKTMFCASVPGSKDSCSGDSGGAAVFNGRVVGIVSFGVGCARRKYPGVYTYVPSVRSFIDNCIKK